jgi:nicotinate-nucleotide adenylyltransferase
MRLGIMGGTFNPVHYGHLIAGQEVKEKMNLDKIIFIPSAHPPHKDEKELDGARDRLAMLKLALGQDPYFSLSTLEIDRGGKSYSFATLRALHKIYGPQTEFFFILGTDAMRDIFSWKNVSEFLRLCRLIVINRPGFSRRFLKKKMPPFHFVRVTPVAISSRNIRKRVREGKPIIYLVPGKVEAYIKRHNLYRCDA